MGMQPQLSAVRYETVYDTRCQTIRYEAGYETTHEILGYASKQHIRRSAPGTVPDRAAQAAAESSTRALTLWTQLRE